MQIVNPQPTVSREATLDDEIRRHWNRADEHARLAVEEAWLAGWKLNQKKRDLPHGEFLPWLESQGYETRRAQRFMRLAREVKCDRLSHFESVGAALASLPPVPYREAADAILDLWRQVFAACETREDRIALLRLRPDGPVSAVRFLEVSGL